MEKPSRGKRASENQKEYLINYLEENLDIANDKFVTADGARHRDEKWKKLAASLNALGGTIKDGPKWKKYWSDLKLNTRSKYAEIKKSEQRSGINGISRLKALSSLEERVIKITTVEAVDGDGTPEVGFEILFLEGNSCEEAETIVAHESIEGTATLAANSGEASESNAASVLPTTSTLTVEPTRTTRTRKRKQQCESLPLEKFFKMDEKKIDELKTANNLKREQIAVLKEQVEATRIQTEAIKSNTQVKENLVGTLQQLINILVEKSTR